MIKFKYTACVCVTYVWVSRLRTQRQTRARVWECTHSFIQQQCWSFSIFASKERTTQLTSQSTIKNDTQKRNLEIWWKPFCVSWYAYSGNMPYKCKQMKWKKQFFNECWKWKHSSTCTHTAGWQIRGVKWSGKKEDEITWTAETKEINCPCRTHH